MDCFDGEVGPSSWCRRFDVKNNSGGGGSGSYLGVNDGAPEERGTAMRER